MKKTNKIFSLIMTTLLLTLSMLTGVMADDVIIPDEVINYIELVVGEDEISAEAIIADESNEELMPLASGGCIDQNYYRGGTSFAPSATDIKLQNGYVKMNCGVSVNLDPNKVLKFGTPTLVTYIPDGLTFYHTSGTHYVIAPAHNTMTEAVFRDLCSRINNP